MAGVSAAWEPSGQFSLVDDGLVGPVKLFTPDQCALAVRHWRHVKGCAPAGWHKSRAAADRFFFDLASRPALLALLRPALGNDIVLWGASVVERTPGRVHVWHTDIESSGGEGFVSVWIGLENTSLESSVKFIPRSHRYGKPVQQLVHEREMPDGAASDETVLGWARDFDASARIVQPEAADGDALLFDGRIWHGSHNMRTEGKRAALLLQYAVAGTQVRKPRSKHFGWPFQFDGQPPPVVVVSGKADASRNHVVRAPEPNKTSRVRAGTVCKALEFPLAEDPEKGWKPYKIFHGSTPNAQSMSAHVSVLSPGRSPHPPHAHVEEEILVVLDGEAEILIGDSADPETARVERAGRRLFLLSGLSISHDPQRLRTTGHLSDVQVAWRARRDRTAGRSRDIPLQRSARRAWSRAGQGLSRAKVLRAADRLPQAPARARDGDGEGRGLRAPCRCA